MSPRALKRRLIGAGERDLPDRGRRLRLLERQRCPCAKRSTCRPSAIAPEDTTITCLPALRQRQPRRRPAISSHAALSCAAGTVDQQARADPDHDARALAHSARASCGRRVSSARSMPVVGLDHAVRRLRLADGHSRHRIAQKTPRRAGFGLNIWRAVKQH